MVKTTIITTFYNKDTQRNESTAFVALEDGTVKIHKFIFMYPWGDGPTYMRDVDDIMDKLMEIYDEVEMVDYHRGDTQVHYIYEQSNLSKLFNKE